MDISAAEQPFGHRGRGMAWACATDRLRDKTIRMLIAGQRKCNASRAGPTGDDAISQHRTGDLPRMLRFESLAYRCRVAVEPDLHRLPHLQPLECGLEQRAAQSGRQATEVYLRGVVEWRHDVVAHVWVAR